MTTVQSQCHTFSVHALLYAEEMRRRNQLILNDLAPRHGFEPRFTAPKAAVLPLDDRGKNRLVSVYRSAVSRTLSTVTDLRPASSFDTVMLRIPDCVISHDCVAPRGRNHVL